MRILLVSSLALVLACGDDDGDTVVDSGPADAGRDAFEPPPDLGVVCEPACTGFETCCAVDGVPTCVDPRTDDQNCGLCGVVCAEGRGTFCEGGFCQCGSARLGCQGIDESYCCPPVGDRITDYCADTRADFRDCGGCGMECDPLVADRCGAGRCVCGESRTGCEGTDESTCCADATGRVECRDTLLDRFHCGGCGNRCELDESCANGSCTLGPTICDERCTDGTICCGGECCVRGACIGGICVGVDPGTPDAGMPQDGGV